MEAEKKSKMRQMAKNFLYEVLLYGVVLIIYFYFALRYLGEPLSRLFSANLSLYTLVGFVLILAQAILLESVINFLAKLIGLTRATK